MAKVLIFEDDTDLLALLKYRLRKEGYQVSGSLTGAGALDLIRETQPDLVILDGMLPVCDGFEICAGIRKDPALAGTPIIFLSARASEADRVRGLELGADDYVVKPFSLPELILRVRKQIRQADDRPDHRMLYAKGIELDSTARQLKVRDELVSLTATEFRLLEYLMINPTRALSRGQLLQSVWSKVWQNGERVVDVYVTRLRKKIEADAENPKLIKAVRGIGYIFDPNAE